MSDIPDLLLNPFRSVFDWVLSILAAVNIQPAAWLVQLLLLALAVLGVWFAARRARAPETDAKQRLAWNAGRWVLAIVGAAILVDWTSQLLFPLPDRVRGVLQVSAYSTETEQCLYATHVELLDFRRHSVGTSPGRPDSRTGAFEVTFKPEFSNPPRYLRVVSACYDSTEVPLTRREIRQDRPYLLPVRARSRTP